MVDLLSPLSIAIFSGFYGLNFYIYKRYSRNPSLLYKTYSKKVSSSVGWKSKYQEVPYKNVIQKTLTPFLLGDINSCRSIKYADSSILNFEDVSSSTFYFSFFKNIDAQSHFTKNIYPEVFKKIVSDHFPSHDSKVISRMYKFELNKIASLHFVTSLTYIPIFKKCSKHGVIVNLESIEQSYVLEDILLFRVDQASEEVKVVFSISENSEFRFLAERITRVLAECITYNLIPEMVSLESLINLKENQVNIGMMALNESNFIDLVDEIKTKDSVIKLDSSKNLIKCSNFIRKHLSDY